MVKTLSRDGVMAIDRFYPGAQALRKAYVSRFSNPLKATSGRFCWDYWNVSDQYRLLRTPAEAFFGPKTFRPFLEHLLKFGREKLGCQMISHPWLSVYVDECYQALHSDVPHGPFSFVYSLTDWERRKFTGGETLIARPKLLRYFSEVRHDESHEFQDFFQRIEPVQNRLVVFDPRYPHGVERVRGASDVLEGRLVIHGWFTEPRPMVEGTLTPEQVTESMDELARSLIQAIEPLEHFGLLSLRVTITREGKISKPEILSAHLLNAFGEGLPEKVIRAAIPRSLRFPKSRGNTVLTLPIEFKR